MTEQERTDLIVDCFRKIVGEGVLQITSDDGKQPFKGVRGELLCLNSDNKYVFSYTRKQALKMLELLTD